MTHSAAAPFEIEVDIQGEKKIFTVKTEETSDGAPYYSCSDGTKNILELRKENNEKWVLLWGDLDDDSTQRIGEAIDSKLI